MNQLLNDDLGMIDSVLIYEPGNFIIYPNLIKMAKTNQQLKRIYLCSGNDIVQYNEIVNRIISPNRKIGKTDIKIKSTNSSITVSCNTVEDFMINDNKLIVTGSDGMPKGPPITLNAGAQTTLRSFEELADLQGQIKPEESVALSQADIDALDAELGVGNESGLTPGQKIVLEGDKMVILDANDMVAETITLDSDAQTALQSLDARADLQAQIKPEFSDLSPGRIVSIQCIL